MTDNEAIEAAARAIQGVRLFMRYNDWTRDHVPGFPIEICRPVGRFDEAYEVVARYPGERESDGVEHLERHVAIEQARAAAPALMEEGARLALEAAAKEVIYNPQKR